MKNQYFPEIKGRFGFGCMRLPMIGADVDMDQFCQMVDYFLDAGFNYFDTAHGYLGGKSELALAKALVARHDRNEYLFANKLSDNFFEKQDDIIPFFNKQLELCGGLDYFDFYLMHCQESRNYSKYQECRAYDVAFELKKQGKIKHLGFSFHDRTDLLEQILNDYPEVEFVQLQFNYLDYGSEDVQSGALYDICKKHGKPVFIMEPVKGGKLAMLPDSTKSIFDKLQNNSASYASYAIRYCLEFENNALILSGVSDMNQIKDNCVTFKDFAKLNTEEQQAVDSVVKEFSKLKTIDCTGCAYCITHNSCPQNINIPQLFSCYNDKQIFDNWNAQEFYNMVLKPNSGSPLDCIECGSCAEECPQHIDIPGCLKKVSAEFEQ